MSGAPIHLAVALDGAGWHPAAWRESDARPDELFDAGYWIDLVQTAERGVIDFVTFEDAFTLQSAHPFVPDDRIDEVRGRLDAALLATRVAPATNHIGLVPTITTTHTEPFHVSLRVASLDFVSGGRAGWRVQVIRQHTEQDLFGRRQLPDFGDVKDPVELLALAEPLFDEAADSIEVARRLWDSWENDAEIRDQSTGRFIDRDKLHYVDFEGDFFSVRGPSITPRPPQGQPVVVALAHATVPYVLAARGADVVFITPHDIDSVTSILAEVRAAEASVARPGQALKVYADLVVLLDDDPAVASSTKARLDQLDGRPLASDARIITGTPAEVADLIEQWHAAGIEGFRLRPARLPADLDAIVDGLVPELRVRGVVPQSYTGATLRERLGLEPALNRYTARDTALSTTDA